MDSLASSLRPILDALSDEEWGELMTRLGLFYMWRYGWDGRLEMEDVLQSTIVAAYSGKRRKPEDTDLVTFLCWTVMRSDTSHVLKRKNQYPIDPIEECSEMDLLKKKDIQRYHQVCAELRDLAGDDALLRMLVEFRILDPDAKLRHMLSLTPSIPEHDVVNAYRRLKKLVEKVKKESGND
jgi:hypothetical protein